MKAYGAKDLPIEIIIHMAPNDYFANVKGDKYLWNSDWKTFDLAEKVTTPYLQTSYMDGSVSPMVNLVTLEITSQMTLWMINANGHMEFRYRGLI